MGVHHLLAELQGKEPMQSVFHRSDLDLFEVLPLHQRANMKLIPDERIPLQQLPLPFTEWCLYRGHNMIDSCETW